MYIGLTVVIKVANSVSYFSKKLNLTGNANFKHFENWDFEDNRVSQVFFCVSPNYFEISF
jgi:hypothetical protein